MPTLTVSANEITDASRAIGTQGDGLTTPDSSFGIWPAATNLITNGGLETNATNWSGASVARSTAQFKFGAASLLVTIAAAGQFGGYSSVTVSNTTQYTASIWIYRTETTHPILFYAQKSTGATVGSQISVPAVLGWSRVTSTFTTDASGVSINLIVQDNSSSNYPYTFYLDGVQFETGPVATPYIETNGSTATRAVCRVQAASVTVTSPSQGGIAQAWRLNFPSTDTTIRTLGSLYKDANNYCRLYWDGAGHFVTETMDAGVSLKATGASATFSVGATRVIIGTWTSAGPNVSDAGAAFVSTAGRGTAFTSPTTFDIGSHNGTQVVGADCFWTGCFTGTVTNANATTINGYGSAPDPTLGTFPSTVGVQAVMPFDTTLYSIVSQLLTGTISLIQELTGTVVIS